MLNAGRVSDIPHEPKKRSALDLIVERVKMAVVYK